MISYLSTSLIWGQVKKKNPIYTIYKNTRKSKPFQILKKCQEETICLQDSILLPFCWLWSQLCFSQVAARMTTACLGLPFSSSATLGERDTLFSKGSIKSHRMKFHWPHFSHMLTSEPIFVATEMQVSWVASPGSCPPLETESNHMD